MKGVKEAAKQLMKKRKNNACTHLIADENPHGDIALLTLLDPRFNSLEGLAARH